VTGDLPGAANMLQEATDGQSEVAGPLAGVVAAAYMLLNAHCDVDAAHRLLTSALLARGDWLDADDEDMDTALHSLLMVCWSSGRLELWADFDTLLTRLTPAPPDLLGVCAATFGDPARQARTALRPLSQALLALRDEHDPVQITRVGVASVYVDRIGDCREPLQRVVDDGREGGAIAAAINALTTLSVDGWFTGRWDEVLELTSEGEKLCEAHGYKRYSWILGGYVATLVAAARGNRSRSLAAADELSDWAHITGAGIAQVFAQHLRTLVALGDGAFSNAYDSVTAISSPGQLPVHVPHALWVPLDLVESAHRSDHHAEARAHAQELDASGIAALSPRLALLTAASGAVVAPDAAFADLFQQALDIPEVERWPFDLARVQLLFGERLRRARSLTLAREQLAASREAFRRLGAVPWTRRAETELRAAGYAGTTPVHTRGIALTAQEREIAELAAAGRTNKEIAEQLFLSPRTVGAHLYKVFPKLGITSRAALRDALTPPSE
jgi:DNA-binding CsgD family transcriptional regulator